MPALFWPSTITLLLSLGSLVFWLDEAYLGLFAAFLITSSFALQVIHILKTRGN